MQKTYRRLVRLGLLDVLRSGGVAYLCDKVNHPGADLGIAVKYVRETSHEARVREVGETGLWSGASC